MNKGETTVTSLYVFVLLIPHGILSKKLSETTSLLPNNLHCSGMNEDAAQLAVKHHPAVFLGAALVPEKIQDA